MPGVAALLILLAGCGSPGEPWQEQAERSAAGCSDCNVVLLVADTLRADRLASFGYHRITSPFLDRLAAESLQFTRARSQSACTFPSVNSLLTSRPVSDFQSPETRPGIPDWIESMPTRLARAGFRTAAVSASPIVRSTESEEGLGGGFGQGFETFDESVLWHRGESVSRAAAAQLRALRGERFFLYVHYMDPHDPYQPPPEVRGTFAREYTGRHDFVAAGLPSILEGRLAEGEPLGVEAADLEHLSDLYDESILGLDAAVAQLFADLEAFGLLERTLVVVTSDHGEAFLEHEAIKHCHDLYDTETRVPLILKIPGIEAPKRIDGLAQNLDVLPTVLDYLGLLDEAEEATESDTESGEATPPLAGRSLRPLIERDEPVHRQVFSSMGALRSANDRRFKLIYSLRDGSVRFFDQVEDPGETTSLVAPDATSGPPAAEALFEALQEWMATAEPDLSREEKLRRAREIEDELRALGYLG